MNNATITFANGGVENYTASGAGHQVLTFGTGLTLRDAGYGSVQDPTAEPERTGLALPDLSPVDWTARSVAASAGLISRTDMPAGASLPDYQPHFDSLFLAPH